MRELLTMTWPMTIMRVGINRSLEFHMSHFVANVGNANTTAIMAGGVAVRAAEGDGG